jgi:hypothetical protein
VNFTPRLLKTSIFILLAFLPAFAFSQTLPVGTVGYEQAFRMGQLAGLQDSAVSFCIRPIYQDSAFPKGKPFLFKILPITLLTQYTTDHPYSMNDGAMIPSKGFQMYTSAGVYAKIGPLTIQLQPEYVRAANLPFEAFPKEHPDYVWTEYYKLHSRIDLPERFGDVPYSRFSLGQSSVRLNAGPVSVGISNENLWWGPGFRNSLLMTNTAPGFKHLSVNTTRPIKTFLGSFEGQLVAGRLDASGYEITVPDSTNPGFVDYYTTPKRDDWRYFNGVVATWQPKWVPGLFIGASRAFEVYRVDLSTRLTNYLPVILPLSKVGTGNDSTGETDYNQLASLFMRWIWPKAHAEIYFEYGRDDHAWNFRDFFLEPEHSSAWVAGFRKMIPVGAAKGQFIDVAMELSHLENPQTSALFRSSGPWYLHSGIRQGYTQQGQLLGAGIGPGSNMQTLEVSWVRGLGAERLGGERLGGERSGGEGLKVIGLRLERYVHDNDFHYIVIRDIRAHWVDFMATLTAQFEIHQFLIFTQLSFINSYNYQHLYVPRIVIDPWWNPGVNTFNFQPQVGVSYRFN